MESTVSPQANELPVAKSNTGKKTRVIMIIFLLLGFIGYTMLIFVTGHYVGRFRAEQQVIDLQDEIKEKNTILKLYQDSLKKKQ